MVKWDDFEVQLPEENKLEFLFEKQKELMKRYGIEIKNINTKEGQIQLRECGMWLFEEIGEVFHCLKNKSWTQSDSEVDLPALYDEVADIWHFFLELNILLGIEPDKAVELYLKKNAANHKRIDTVY